MDGDRLTIEVTSQGSGGPAEARLSGELDLVSADETRKVLNELLDVRPSELHLDLAGTTFVDSTGLGVLVGVHHAATSASVPLVLVGVSVQLRRVMEITRLDELFVIR